MTSYYKMLAFGLVVLLLCYPILSTDENTSKIVIDITSSGDVQLASDYIAITLPPDLTPRPDFDDYVPEDNSNKPSATMGEAFAVA